MSKILSKSNFSKLQGSNCHRSSSSRTTNEKESKKTLEISRGQPQHVLAREKTMAAQKVFQKILFKLLTLTYYNNNNNNKQTNFY
jgi:hypothetical protein